MSNIFAVIWQSVSADGAAVMSGVQHFYAATAAEATALFHSHAAVPGTSSVPATATVSAVTQIAPVPAPVPPTPPVVDANLPALVDALRAWHMSPSMQNANTLDTAAKAYLGV